MTYTRTKKYQRPRRRPHGHHHPAGKRRRGRTSRSRNSSNKRRRRSAKRRAFFGGGVINWNLVTRFVVGLIAIISSTAHKEFHIDPRDKKEIIYKIINGQSVDEAKRVLLDLMYRDSSIDPRTKPAIDQRINDKFEESIEKVAKSDGTVDVYIDNEHAFNVADSHPAIDSRAEFIEQPVSREQYDDHRSSEGSIGRW